VRSVIVFLPLIGSNWPSCNALGESAKTRAATKPVEIAQATSKMDCVLNVNIAPSAVLTKEAGHHAFGVRHSVGVTLWADHDTPSRGREHFG
jgi:hypothetical protein